MKWILVIVAFMEAPITPALAHTVIGQTGSFVAGIVHPLSGADHVLAMTMVGFWSWLSGGRARWLWPMTFMAGMLGGFAAAIFGLHISFAEVAIGLSIITLALLIALGVSMRLWLGAAIIGLFSFFHGHAHGTEAVAGSILPYAAGFALTTGALLVFGIGVGLCAGTRVGRLVFRAKGGVATSVMLSLHGG